MIIIIHFIENKSYIKKRVVLIKMYLQVKSVGKTQ